MNQMLYIPYMIDPAQLMQSYQSNLTLPAKDFSMHETEAKISKRDSSRQGKMVKKKTKNPKNMKIDSFFN